VLVAAVSWTALWSGVTYAVIGSRPRGWGDRFFWFLGSYMLFAWVLQLLLTGWPPLGHGTMAAPWLVATTYVGMTVAAVFGWRKRKRTASIVPSARTRLPLIEYAIGVVVIVALHNALAKLSADFHDSAIGRHAAEASLLSGAGLTQRAVIFALFFVASQVITGFALRSLTYALQRDWTVAEGKEHRRHLLLLLGAGPIALCIIPSIAQDALLLGVISRLAMLGWAWWRGLAAPLDRAADFLSWHPVMTPARAALRSAFAQARERR
jgi:hypothetical protein